VVSLSATVPRRSPVAVAILGTALVLAVALSLAIGRVAVPLGEQIAILADALGLQPYAGEDRLAAIMLDIRLPRVLLAALVGAALGAAGAGLQGMFRNPLADPYLIGASSGAAVAALLMLTIELPAVVYRLGGVQVAAFVGSLGAVGIAVALARSSGYTAVPSLLLAGVAVAALGGAITSYLLFASGEHIFSAYAFLLGGFNTADMELVAQVAVPIAIGVAMLALLGPALDLLQIGEESAEAMGLRVEWTKMLAIVAATLATAAAVSAAGLIAFVGLVVPHIVRLLAGPGHRALVLQSVIGGAAFLVACDLVARTLLSEGNLPVGVVTAAIGAPFFLLLLRARRRRLA